MATATGAANSEAGAAANGEKGSILKLPISSPMQGISPKARPDLTADQQTKYDWLLAEAKTWTSASLAHGKTGDKAAGESSPLSESEREWLTRECLLRYLRATKWQQNDAEKRLLDTIAWRRAYGVERTLTADHISPENETGKQITLGYDKEGRPCHYLNPGRQNTEPSPRQVQHLVFMLERVLDIMPPGQETLALLINFKQSKSRSNTAPGIGQAREVLHILQNHYPERLGKALIINGMCCSTFLQMPRSILE
jgi:hypothetical protein